MAKEGRRSTPASTQREDHFRGVIAVTGATGFVGRHLTRMLVKNGYQVRALTRSTSKARNVFPTSDLNGKAIILVSGTMSDPDKLNTLVKGCDACIHLVGIIRETKGQTFESVHVDGTRAIINACKDRDSKFRYIHMSALGVGPSPRAGYRDTKHRAEQIVKGSGLRWTIVRPGLIHGHDGEFTQQAVGWVRGKEAPYLFLPYFSRWKQDGFGFEPPTVAPIFVDDVARVFVESIGNERAIGHVYEISGSQRVEFPEMLRIYAKQITPEPKSKPAIGVPWRVAVAQAKLAKMVGLGGLLPFDEGMATMGARDSVADNTDVERDFGFTPAGFEESLSTYAERL